MLDQDVISEKVYEILKIGTEPGEIVNDTPLHGQVWGYSMPYEKYFYSN
jgi:hypothetical protein